MAVVNNLLRRPWFTRAWTLQKAALARKAHVLCGSKSLDWGLLGAFRDICQDDTTGRWTNIQSAITSASTFKTEEVGRFDTAHINATSKLKAALEVQGAAGPANTKSLLLHRIRRCGATVPKDKILFLSTSSRLN